jgi:hypothetical protein
MTEGSKRERLETIKALAYKKRLRHLYKLLDKKRTGLRKMSSTGMAHVLVCTGGESELSRLICELIRKRYDVEVMTPPALSDAELLGFAKQGLVDLFIIVLNNILYDSKIFPGRFDGESSLHFVSCLRGTYHVPVIALYGYPRETSYAKRLKLTGINFLFSIPCKVKELQDAVGKCLGFI